MSGTQGRSDPKNKTITLSDNLTAKQAKEGDDYKENLGRVEQGRNTNTLIDCSAEPSAAKSFTLKGGMSSGLEMPKTQTQGTEDILSLTIFFDEENGTSRPCKAPGMLRRRGICEETDTARNERMKVRVFYKQF